MRTWMVVLAALASALGGCVNVSVARVGERFPPNPEGCQLDFQYGDMGKAMQLVGAGYVQVGSITVLKGGDSFDDEMKERVRPYACKLGGDVVMMGSSSEGSFTTNFSYASIIVLHKNAPVVSGTVQGDVKAP